MEQIHVEELASRSIESELFADVTALRADKTSVDAQQAEVTADESGAGPWTARRKWAEIPDESVLVDLSQAPGKVCTAALIPYPPGIPLLCPGEIISEEDVRYISLLRKRGEKVIGVDHKGRVAVGGPV